MRRTGAGILILAAVLGLGAGFLLDHLLTLAGRPTFSPSPSLPVLLVLLGALVVVLAIPISRATRGASALPVDPFRALRIAMLAKASSLVGAAVGGFALGLLLYLLNRPVVPSLGSMGAIIATAAAAVILVAAGLVAEYLCTIRKDDDDEQPGGAPPGLEPGAH